MGALGAGAAAVALAGGGDSQLGMAGQTHHLGIAGPRWHHRVAVFIAPHLSQESFCSLPDLMALATALWQRIILGSDVRHRLETKLAAFFLSGSLPLSRSYFRILSKFFILFCVIDSR